MQYIPFSPLLGRGCPVDRVLISGPEGPGSRLDWRKLPCTLMAPGACKIRRGYNVLQVPIQIIPLGAPKRGSPLSYILDGAWTLHTLTQEPAVRV